MELKFLRSRLSRVFAFILLPFDLRELVEILRGTEYEITLPGPLPPPPIRVGGAGFVARKGEYLVYLDIERQIVAVEGSFPVKKTVGYLNEVDKILINALKIDIYGNTRYCEAFVNLEIDSQDPIGRLKNLFKEADLISGASKLMGEEIALVSFRLGPRAKLSTQETWFDISIQPRWDLPTKCYLIDAVYRDKNEEKVKKFLEEFEEKIVDLLKLIERG